VPPINKGIQIPHYLCHLIDSVSEESVNPLINSIITCTHQVTR